MKLSSSPPATSSVESALAVEEELFTIYREYTILTYLHYQTKHQSE